MTAQRTFHVLAIDSEAACTAAKDEARRAGLRVVTVAAVRPAGDGSWLVVLAVRDIRRPMSAIHTGGEYAPSRASGHCETRNGSAIVDRDQANPNSGAEA